MKVWLQWSTNPIHQWVDSECGLGHQIWGIRPYKCCDFCLRYLEMNQSHFRIQFWLRGWGGLADSNMLCLIHLHSSKGFISLWNVSITGLPGGGHDGIGVFEPECHRPVRGYHNCYMCLLLKGWYVYTLPFVLSFFTNYVHGTPSNLTPLLGQLCKAINAILLLIYKNPKNTENTKTHPKIKLHIFLQNIRHIRI